MTEISYDYRIGAIIPNKVGMLHKTAVEMDDVSMQEFEAHTKSAILNNSKMWEDKKSYDEVGARQSGGYLLKMPNKKAFGDWVFAKSERTAPWAWNPKTQERIYLNLFELYVIVREYQIHSINALHLNIDGTSNPEPFDSPIDYSEFIEEN